MLKNHPRIHAPKGQTEPKPKKKGKGKGKAKK